jgi:oligo-1,6-glucosidase
MGYDISDYEKVYAPYGTVKDMEDLIEACHSRYLTLSPHPVVGLG